MVSWVETFQWVFSPETKTDIEILETFLFVCNTKQKSKFFLAKLANSYLYLSWLVTAFIRREAVAFSFHQQIEGGSHSHYLTFHEKQSPKKILTEESNIDRVSNVVGKPHNDWRARVNCWHSKI